MKTEQFIDLLAASEAPVAPVRSSQRFGWVALAGAAIALPILLGTIRLNPHLLSDMALPMYWVKSGAVAIVVLLAWQACARLARPGMALGEVPRGLLSVLIFIWLMGLAAMLNAQPEQRMALWMGGSWESCIPTMLTLSAPAWLMSMAVMKRMAPTRPALAGAAAGLLASATGALVYTLHCPELAAPFLAIWYVAGIALPALLGALAGNWYLRW